MEVVLSVPGGDKHVIEVGPSWVGADVKKELTKLLSVDASLLELEHEGSTIEDTQEISGTGLGSGALINVILNRVEEAKQIIRQTGIDKDTAINLIIKNNDVEFLDVCCTARFFCVSYLHPSKLLDTAPDVMDYVLSCPDARSYVARYSKSALRTCVQMADLSRFKQFCSFDGVKKNAPRVEFVIKCLIENEDALFDFMSYYTDTTPHGEETHEYVLGIAARHLPHHSNGVFKLMQKTPNFPSAAFITSLNRSHWDWADAILENCTDPPLKPTDVHRFAAFSFRGMQYLDILLDKGPVKQHSRGKLASTIIRSCSLDLPRGLLSGGVPDPVARHATTLHRLMELLQYTRSDCEAKTLIETAVGFMKDSEIEKLLKEVRLERLLTIELFAAMAQAPCKGGDTYMVKMIAERFSVLFGGQPFSLTDATRDPLSFAIQKGRDNCAKVLLEYADYSQMVYSDGSTPLGLVVNRKDASSMSFLDKLLPSCGADLVSLLVSALIQFNFYVASCLVEKYNVSPNSKLPSGDTVLHFCIRNVSMLRNQGKTVTRYKWIAGLATGSLHAKDAGGLTPLELATQMEIPTTPLKQTREAQDVSKNLVDMSIAGKDILTHCKGTRQ